MSAGAASEAALEALFVPFATGVLSFPNDGDVLMLRARDGFALREQRRPGWTLQQSFKPAADALVRSGFTVVAEPPSRRFRAVLVLPTRQREETRALFSMAMRSVVDGGIIVASVPNAEGAKTAEADLRCLVDEVHHLSKHKCPVFWTCAGAAHDPSVTNAWQTLDEPLTIDGGYVSRRGLFAWDRVDVASALLAEALPDDLAGSAADLGAGFGYLACEAIARCPGMSSMALYEAEARALEPARHNVERAVAKAGRSVATEVHWHDVTQGLEARYDVIVSNPPFHQGRADQPELGRAFIEAAANALSSHGRFWMVANRHLPYETTLDARFADVRRVVDRDGFKVIEAREPRR